MDYEKKYNEVLATAKRIISDNCSKVEKLCLECVFPELRESEDERIRKAIVELLKEIEEDETYTGRQHIPDMLAYLEKQKDSKWSPSEDEMGVLYRLCYVSNQVTDEDDTELTRLYQDLKREYFNGHSFENMFPSEKQKERKPTPTPERIRPKFAVGDTICHPMRCDHTVQEIYVRCADPIYVCVNEEGLESHISFSEQNEWKRKEQKPFNVCESCPYYKDCPDYNEKKPAEWSEEDEEYLDGIRATLLEIEDSATKIDGLTESQWVAIRAAHRLLGELKSLRPQPHWKPSEEQN